MARKISYSSPARKRTVAQTRTRKSTALREDPLVAIALGLALFLLVLFVFAPAYHAGFIWDDDQLLTANPQVHDNWGWLTLWASPATADYFPLMSTTLWLEYHLGQIPNVIGPALAQLWNVDYLQAMAHMHPLDNPLNGYHIMNVIFHGIAVVLTWRMLKRLNVPGAWLAAAIFAVHPVCVESVAWISERKNSVAQIFLLLSIIKYVDSEEKGRLGAYIWAVVFFLLSLLAKTSVVPLPFILLLLAWWRKEKIQAARASYQFEENPYQQSILFWSCVIGMAVFWGGVGLFIAWVTTKAGSDQAAHYAVYILWASLVFGLGVGSAVGTTLGLQLSKLRIWNNFAAFEIMRCVPFFLLALVLGAVTVFFQNGRAIGGEEIPIGSWWQRIASACFAAGFYLYSALWPFNIIEIYPQWHRAFSEKVLQPYPHIQPPAPESIPYWLQAVPGVVIAAVFAICWKFRARTWARALLVGLGCYFIAILPALGLTYMSYMRLTLVADHFQYVSIIAVIALVVAAGTTLAMKPPWLCLAAACFALIGWLNWKQTGDPSTGDNHIEIVLWFFIPLALAAASAAPEVWKGVWWTVMAGVLVCFSVVSYAQSGLYYSEKTLWGATLKKNPFSWQAHNHMGAALYMEGNWRAAGPHFLAATQLKMENPESHNNLGLYYSLLAQNGEPEKMADAINQFKIAVQIKDDSAMDTNLGNAYEQTHQYDDAIKTYKHALDLNPNNASALCNLGFALMQEGKVDDAINYFMQSVKADPNMDQGRKDLLQALRFKGVNFANPAATGSCSFNLQEALDLVRPLLQPPPQQQPQP